MIDFASQLFNNIIYSSFCVIILLILKKWLLNKFNGIQYLVLWLIPLFGVINPISIAVPASYIFINENAINNILTKYHNVFICVCVIWLIGIVLFGCIFLRKKTLYTKIITDETKTASAAIQKQLMKYIKKLNIKQNVTIHFSTNIISPMVIYKKSYLILIPDIEWSDIKLKYVLLHELCHIKHHDIIIKSISHYIKLFFWWNPFIYLINKAIEEACEFSCDRHVLNIVGIDKKSHYCNAMIDLIEISQMRKVEFVAFFSKYIGIKLRIHIMMNNYKPQRFIFTIIVLFLLFGNFIALRSILPTHNQKIVAERHSGIVYVRETKMNYNVNIDGVISGKN